MSIGLTYQDSVELIKPAIDEYGSETAVIGDIATVPALYIQNTGWSHGQNRKEVTSDAEIYIDPTDDFVTSNFNRLDGMLVIANPFSSPTGEAWYRIIDVSVGQDKLLENQIDNIRLQLKKTSEIPYVS